MRCSSTEQDDHQPIAGSLLFLLAMGTMPSASLASPPNDECASSTAISDGTFNGTTISAISDGGASCGSSSGSPDVWYEYTSTCAGTVHFDTCGSGLDTVLSAHRVTGALSVGVFSAGGFEFDMVGSHPSTASPGAWSITETNDVSSSGIPRVEVRGPAAPGPGASGGQKYLSLYKDLGDVANAITVFPSPVSQAQARLTAVFSLYVSGTDAGGNPRTGGDGNHFQAQFTQSAAGGFASRLHWFGLTFPGGDVGGLVNTTGIQPGQMAAVYYDGAWRNLKFSGAPVFVSSNAWHSVVITLTLGVSYVVTFDGQQSDPVSIEPGLASAAAAGLELRPNVGNRDSQFYVDNLTVSLSGDCPANAANELACNDNCAGSPCGSPSSCLTLPLSVGDKIRLRVAGVNGSSGNFTLHAACSAVPRPPNDDCSSSTVITDGHTPGTTIGATLDGSASCGNSNSSPDVWYAYTVPGNGTLAVSMTGSNGFTQAVVSAHSGCPGTSANTLACGSGGAGSGFTMPVTQGQTVWLRASGANGAQGDYMLGVQFSPPPDPPQGQLDPYLKITWHLGPDLPQGFQDSDGGIIHNTLITVGGFCAGQTVPSKPGRYPRGFLQKAWGLDMANRAAGWFPLPDFPGAARQELFSVRVNDQLYFWGGFSYSLPYAYADGWRLSNENGQWIWSALPDLPWKVCSSGMAVVGGRIYLLGGADYDTNAFFTDSDRFGGNPNLGSHLLMLDTANLASGWQALPDCPGTPRWVHTMSAVGGKLYVIGGATGDNAAGTGFPYCSVVDNWKFDPDTNAWSRLRDLPISSGNFPNGSNIVYQDRYIILVGGFQYACTVNNRLPISPYGNASRELNQNQTYFNDMFVYDTVNDLFGTTDKLPLNNNLPMAVVSGSEIFLIGGEIGWALLTDHLTGATYDPNGEYFGHHPDLCLTGHIQVVTVRPDFDLDRDVDGQDFTNVASCALGPGVAVVDNCQSADMDGDADVDQDDFGVLQRCFSGAGKPVKIGCDQ